MAPNHKSKETEHIYLEVSHFKMESVLSLGDSLRRNYYLAKTDLKDAYLTVPIYRGHRKYLRFRWEDRRFQFKSLPFGLVTAPRVFTKLLRPVAAKLRLQVLLLIVYLDDILIMEDSPTKLKKHAQLLVTQLQDLDFVLNTKKNVWKPSQLIRFLGFLVDSKTMSLSLPSEKILKIQKECRHMLIKTSTTARELAHLIGLLTSVNAAMPTAPLHYRALQRLCNRTTGHSRQYGHLINLEAESRGDLSFWVQHLREYNGRQTNSIHDYFIRCIQVWVGCQLRLLPNRRALTKLEAADHINFLELKAAFLVLKTYAAQAFGQHILLLIDNITVITYLNRKGGTHSRKLSDLAITIWEWCIKKSITIHAEHIHTRCSQHTSRYESWKMRDSSDWKLDPALFQILCMRWGISMWTYLQQGTTHNWRSSSASFQIQKL